MGFVLLFGFGCGLLLGGVGNLGYFFINVPVVYGAFILPKYLAFFLGNLRLLYTIFNKNTNTKYL